MSVIMFNHRLLVVLTTLGSALCWWPMFIEPRLELPFWTPIACAALCTGASTILDSSRWLLFLAASGLGSFGGLSLGCGVWAPSHPLDAEFAPIFVVAFTVATVLGSLLAGWTARKVFPPDRTRPNRAWRGVVWALLCGCIAFGPVALAITRPVVARRMAYDERMAGERFTSLKKAVERVATEGGRPNRLCDGTEIEHYYSGPPFSDEDWRRVTGNYVKQDGYFFMVYCREKGGYTIDANPAEERGHGGRRFCTDESGAVGCRVKWDRSRYRCLPC